MMAHDGFLPDRPSLSLFQQPWWLEATAAGSWSEVAVEEDGVVVARLPFVTRRRYGLRLLTMPKLTQSLGPWIREYPSDQAARLSLEKRLFGRLIDMLPPHDVF